MTQGLGIRRRKEKRGERNGQGVTLTSRMTRIHIYILNRINLDECRKRICTRMNISCIVDIFSPIHTFSYTFSELDRPSNRTDKKKSHTRKHTETESIIWLFSQRYINTNFPTRLIHITIRSTAVHYKGLITTYLPLSIVLVQCLRIQLWPKDYAFDQTSPTDQLH